ncbi:hypothetical protein CDV36_006094 [Fusarium kuroshium]|uniref:Uncharacterized protein n=1 Tax=Fusarium kuroshium TaxID=2010991 RepID=A0A3M2S9M1_9HYPO|nr:hypothetical protein CDV36_006094 [Fusarium kuroshium]
MATRNIVLITGANSGIGLELAKLLFGSRQSYHVLLGARSAEKGAAAAKQLQAQFPSTSNSVEVAQIDVTKDESITRAFEKINTEHGRIDFLVNNAGFCHNDDILKETSIRKAWNDMYDTNVTGQHVVTETFAPLLIKSSDPRLLFVTSGTANVTRFSQEYWPGPPPAAVSGNTLPSTGYSFPEEARKIFFEGIISNPLIAPTLPPEAVDLAQSITFKGSPEPSLPINWRFAESISSLKAYEALFLSVLLKRKYGLEQVPIEINTDHAQLFLMSSLIWTLDPDGENLNAGSIMNPEGSMNPDPTLDSIGLPHDMQADSLEEAREPFVEAVGKFTSEMQHLATDVYRQAGTICYTVDEYRQAQEPGWWPSTETTSPARPLAGLKVVDLTRVIAAPATSRGLAEYGASVMRVVAPHLLDTSPLHLDLNHGKWNACLDLRQEEDRKKLKALIMDADIVLQGYRPGVFDKYGFSEQDIIDMCRERERGIIYARENCYGWQGPWKDRSGWQQISDANCGVSYEFGRAMGNDEPVTPVFPNSDYCTGVAGICGILSALIRRGESGGSYTVDIALNYYSQWLVNSVGTYPDQVWQDLWKRNGSPVFRYFDPMQTLVPKTLQVVMKNSGQALFKPKFFHQYSCRYLGKDVKIVAPILRFPNGDVKPGFNVGTRSNGVDAARWPEDLSVEVVT